MKGLSTANAIVKFFEHSVAFPRVVFLGPLLFILYINDCAKVSPVLKTIIFADDTTVSASGLDFRALCDTVDAELDKIKSWLIANRLSINGQKTEWGIGVFE